MPSRICLSVGIVGVSLALAMPAADDPVPTPGKPPTRAEQQAILQAIQKYAERYVSNLPNFICEQVTEQFEAGKKPTHWRKGDTLTAKLVFNEGREERKLQLVNNKPPRPGSRPWRTPLTTEGEFGILLGSVFGGDSNAHFSWNRWDVLDGRNVAVFDYAIDGLHSTLRLSLSDLARATVPYRGTVFADPSTGVVWRITNEANDIPPEVQTKSIGTTIDYGQISIGAGEYILPVSATVQLQTDSSNVRNQIEFRHYRKFEAESSITYASGTADNSSEAGQPSSSGNPP